MLAPSTTQRRLHPPWNNPHPARPRREMASPSHTSGRSPPKESGPAHPQFAKCPACAAKWTRPPGAGWAPGASRGRSSGVGSVLAVKKTSTLNGRFLLPRPTFQPRRSDCLRTQAPPPLASGTVRILRNPRARALPWHSEATGPAGSGPRSRGRLCLFPTLGRDLVSPLNYGASRTASPRIEDS